MDIIISNKSSKPIYEQIANQIKELVMNGDLRTGDPIPSMRSLAKSLHVSVISVQHAYEDLQRDGFIETTVGRGTFISANNIEFIKEEHLKQVEELLQRAADIGRTNGISIKRLFDLLSMFYEEG